MIYPIKPNHPGPYRKPNNPCRSCPLYGKGMGFGFPTIGGMNGVMVVAESLGEHEANKGEFLIGPAGWQFNHVLKRGGFKREDFTAIENVIHCRPPNNKLSGQSYEQEAILKCAPFLDETIELTKPKAILAMGGVALKRLTGQSGILKNRGFIFESKYGIPVVGTFHPSYLLPRKKEKSSAKYTWVMIMDMRKALRIAQGRREILPQNYLLDPSIDKAKQFIGEYERTDAETFMAWDLETVFKLKHRNEQKLKLESRQTITRTSFAFKPGHAMTIPWEPDYIQKVVEPIFRMNRPKVDWNGLGFDRPIILFQEGMELNGTLLDGMDTWHTLQPNLEKGLEFVASIMTEHLSPWKHTSQSEPEFYNAQDSDATITNFLSIIGYMKSQMIPEYGI